MADWDTSNPADNAVVSVFPANERTQRAAQQTNFGVDHHATNDAKVGQHEKVTLIEQASDPSALAATGFVYVKAVNGIDEVFYRDSAGSITQLTTAGRVRGQLKPQLKTANYTAVAGDCILVDKSAGSVTITLPAAPSIGDEPISVTHVNGTANTLTVARNGNNIMALAQDLTVDANYASIVLYWAGATPGWRLGIVG